MTWAARALGPALWLRGRGSVIWPETQVADDTVISTAGPDVTSATYAPARPSAAWTPAS